MAVTCVLYDQFKANLLSLTDSIDFNDAGTTLKVALCTGSYVPASTDSFFDDVTNELATAGNYTAGGATVTGKATAVDAAGHFGYCDADDVTWTAATFTCALGVLYKSTGTPSTSPLIGYIDFGGDQSPLAVNFTIQWALPTLGGMVKIA